MLQLEVFPLKLGLGAGELASIARIFAQTGQSLDQIESSLRAVARASLALHLEKWNKPQKA